MSNTTTTFEPITVLPLEPYGLANEINLTEKDRILIEHFLSHGNKPSHVSGIAREATIKDKSGKKIQGITKKHISDRCKYLEKRGILKYVREKPLRGAGYKTRHYFLSDDIEAFQTIVELYLNRENIMRKLLFMESKYLDECIDKNIKKLLLRWLVPDESEDFNKELLLFLVQKKLQKVNTESSYKGKGEKQQTHPMRDETTRSTEMNATKAMLQALKSITREEVENEILSLSKDLGMFTEEQTSTYASIAKISPAALHLLVFLPFPKLVEQYEKLGLTRILFFKDIRSQKKLKQKQEWLLLNRIIHEILFHSMMGDMLRYPFLIVPVHKEALFLKIMLKDRVYKRGFHESLMHLRTGKNKTRRARKRKSR